MSADFTAVDDTLNGIAASPVKLFSLGQIIRNRSFPFITGIGSPKKLQRIEKGVF